MHVRPEEAGATTPRALGRIVLASLLALLVGLVVLPWSLSFAQDATTVSFVNPTASSSNVISDKQFPYGITAWVDAVPTSPRVEFQLKNNSGAVGPVIPATQGGTSPDTFMAEWTIPDEIADGSYTLEARLYRDYTGPGTGTLVDTDEEAVVLDQAATTSPLPGQSTPAGENVQISYPTNGGALGVSVPASGGGFVILEGEATSTTSTVQGFYSLTPRGGETEFKSCTSATTISDGDNDGDKEFKLRCTVAEGDFPLDIEAVAVVPTRANAIPGLPGTEGASDGHTVITYFQRPETVTLEPEQLGNAPINTCQKFTATVLDQLGRPIAGANVDAHAQGPDDQLKFNTATAFSDASQAPDKGDHGAETGWACDAAGTGGAQGAAGTQGSHPIAGSPSRKHVESTATGTNTNGQWTFGLRSPSTGTTQVTVWGDLDDDDQYCADEASDSSSIGWGVPAPAVTPETATVPTGACTVGDPSPSPSASGSPTASPSESVSASPSESPSMSPSTSPSPDPEPEFNARTITLNFKHARKGKSLVAKGRVTVNDPAGYEGCAQQVPVKVQRKVKGGWATVKQVDTRNTGKYKVVFKHRKGLFRALAPQVEKENGMQVCGKTQTQKKHKHK